ncbi:hypothetical protein Bca101_090371 [Brassica carinata]
MCVNGVELKKMNVQGHILDAFGASILWLSLGSLLLSFQMCSSWGELWWELCSTESSGSWETSRAC